jgi:cell division cycle 20, cofactor of APC complex
MTISNDIVDFESMMDLSTNISSSVLPRWQRKAQSSSSDKTSDRFIPSRASTNFDISSNENIANADLVDGNSSDYSKLVQQGVLGKEDSCVSSSSGNNTSRILAYKNKAPAPKEGYQNSLKVLYSQQAGKKTATIKPTRHIASAPVRILDAPDLLDDYYLNLLSWSSTNQLAVALSQAVYLWDAGSGQIKELMNVETEANDDYISSVSWIQQGGSHIAVGTANNTVQLWDVQAEKKIRTLTGHSARVGALAWNEHILSSGSRDTTILNHDVRIQQHVVGKMAHHTQEVCGLSWSPDGKYLASGANDNALCIWDSDTSQSMNATPKYTLTDHTAAVKALAWSPHERNLLASGGGTADRCIKFWNAQSGACLNSIDTGSQVCALQWSPMEKELLSSHGYAENQLCLWKYPTMAKVKELKGHTSRILHLATSPDGSTVVSGAADETLRFWNVFASDGKGKSSGARGEHGASARLNKAGNLRIR